jgi:hypothetical protein
MQNRINKLLIAFAILLTLNSCEAIAGIFKAGMGFGIFIVVTVIAIILYIISKFFKKG